jgi:PleD family two-component response regulator
MIEQPGRRRVLVAAGAEDRFPLPLQVDGALKDWEVRTADSFARAHFLLQHDRCDVLLLDEGLARCEGWSGLTWLTAQESTPVVLLAGGDPGVIAAALRAGVQQWLPRDLALRHPDLLAATLEQAARWGTRRGVWRASTAREGREQVSRLVDLLWEAAPVSGRSRWLTQRHALERLDEEVARAERHGTPLSLALGDVQAYRPPGAPGGDELPLTAALGERIASATRRGDVAGRYGPEGFLLLLVNTPGPGAEACCRRLQGLLGQARVLVQFGIASYSTDLRTPQAVLSRAEQGLERTRRTAPDYHAARERPL